MKRELKQVWRILTSKRTPEIEGAHDDQPTQRHYSAHSPTQQQGARGEDMARAYLEQRGLKFIDSNIASALGEIDLLMSDDDALVFVEVKMRRSAQFGGVMSAITPHKLTKLRRAIELFLQQHPHYARLDCRIDALLIQHISRPDAPAEITWLKNIGAD